MSELHDGISNFINNCLLENPTSIVPIHGGANNQTYKIIVANKTQYALKAYHIHDFERDLLRMQREYDSFSFLQQCGEKQIPTAFARDQSKLFALYSWIDGEKVTKIFDHDMQLVINFIARLKNYSTLKSAEKILPASDNVLCVTNIFQQIQRRLNFLEEETCHNQFLHFFLDKQYKPFYQNIKKMILQKPELLWKSLSLNQAILSPSDFGFHNILKKTDNSIVFIDFEYFGWEDPAALLAHFLLHPGMQLSKRHKKLFFYSMSSLFDDDLFFEKRFHVLYFLLGFVWVLILLNEFLPFIQKRRLFSGQCHINDIAKLQAEQLDKAQKQLERLVRLTQLNYFEHIDHEAYIC